MRDDFQGGNYGDFQTIATTFTQGLRELPTDYVTRVRNFLLEYLGSPQHPVPFGGRTKEFASLTSWLADPQASSYLLLAAPAGRGKSALLLRWCQQIFGRHDLAIAYFPVSIRFRTNLAGVAFPSLVALLARLHGEKVPIDPNLSEEIWRGLLVDYIQRPLPDGRTLLLVIDGIDEAADWSAGSGIFPLDVPSGLRVILSARSLANDQGADAWLQRLGWTRPGLASTLELYPLDRNGIASVLTQMGFPLDLLSTRVNIVSELYRLSEGDPLLVRLYIADLWERGEAVVRLQPEDLRAIRPGLAGYFERWWQDQRLLWSKEAAQREAIAQTVLNLLAAALGPLSQSDILSLVPPEEDFNADNLNAHLAPLARFVTGDGLHQGYVFSHPRLGNYFLEERMNETERQIVEQRFLDWGEQTLIQLQEGRIQPAQASSYCIQYYGAHLERANADARTLLTLVNQGWLRAWEKLDRASAGFLSDVERAWRAIERENQTAIAYGQPAPYLGEAIRCLLCQVSVNSVTNNISPRLMLEAVKAGVWTPAQGLACIRLISELAPRARELAGLAPYVQEPLRTDILQEALDTIASIKDEYGRLDALVELAPALPEELLWQVLEVLPCIEDEADRAGIIAELALAFAPYPAIIERTLAYIEAMEEQEYQALALEGLAPGLTIAHSEEVWLQVETLSDARYQAQALTALVPVLTERRLWDTLELTHTMQDGLSRMRLLAELAVALPEHAQAEALQETLDLLREIEDREYRVEIQVKLAPFLSEELLTKALHEIQLLWDENARANALLGLLPHLPTTLLPEFQNVVLTFKSDEHCTRVLTTLIPRLSDETLMESETLVNQALKRVQSTWDEGCRVELLAQFTLSAPKSLLPRLLEIISTVRDQGYRTWLLAELEVPLATKLHDAHYNVAAVFQAMKGREDRLQTLLAIAPRLSTGALLKIFNFMLPEIFDFTWRVQNDESRAQILAKLGPRLPEDWLNRAMTAIRGMGNEIFQVQALIALAPRIQGPWLSEALDIVRNIRDRERRAQVLEILVSSLPEEKKGERVQEMLLVLQVIKDEAARVHSSRTYASSLPTKLSLTRAHTMLQATYTMQHENHKIQILIALTPHLPEEVFEEVLKILPNLKPQNVEEQDLLLEALAPHIPDQLFSSFIGQIRSIPEAHWRSHILTKALTYAPKELIREMLLEVLNTQDMEHRSEMLAALAPYVPQEFFAQVWDMLKTFSDESMYARTIGILAIRQPKDFFAQLWDTIQALPNDLWQLQVLKAMAPHASEYLLSQTLDAILTIKDKEKRARFVTVLAPYLPERFFSKVWGKMSSFPEKARWQILEALAPHVPARFFPTFLATTQKVSHTWTQIQILQALIPSVPEDSFEQMWDTIEKTPGIKVQELLLVKMAQHAPPQLSLQAWQRIQAITTPATLWGNIAKTVLLLPSLVLKNPAEILKIIRGLPEDMTKIEAVEVLAPNLSPVLAQEILHLLLPLQPGEDLAEVITTEKIQDNKGSIQLLAVLAPYLPEEMSEIIVSSLLKIIQDLKGDEDRTLLLQRIVLRVPPTLLSETLETIQAITIPTQRTKILTALLSALAPDAWPTVITWVTRKIHETDELQFSLQVVGAAGPLLQQSSPALLYPLVYEILHHLTQHTRQEAMSNISNIVPALLVTGGEEAITEACSANLEVGCWWP